MISVVANAPNAATGADNPQHHEARFSAGEICSVSNATTGLDDGILAKSPPPLFKDPVPLSTCLAALLDNALGAPRGLGISEQP